MAAKPKMSSSINQAGNIAPLTNGNLCCPTVLPKIFALATKQNPGRLLTRKLTTNKRIVATRQRKSAMIISDFVYAFYAKSNMDLVDFAQVMKQQAKSNQGRVKLPNDVIVMHVLATAICVCIMELI